MPKGLRPITTINVFNESKSTAASQTSTSQVIDLREICQEGLFSIQYLISGDGTATLAYTVCSTHDGTFYTPTGGGSITSGLTKTSGNGAGLGGLTFEVEQFPFMKITVTETGTSSAVVATLFLNIQ